MYINIIWGYHNGPVPTIHVGTYHRHDNLGRQVQELVQGISVQYECTGFPSICPLPLSNTNGPLNLIILTHLIIYDLVESVKFTNNRVACSLMFSRPNVHQSNWAQRVSWDYRSYCCHMINCWDLKPLFFVNIFLINNRLPHSVQNYQK